MRGILFGVWPAGPAVKNVIRREVNQPGVDLPADHGDVPHCQRIYFVGRAWLFLGDVHLVVRHGVEDYRRIRLD